MEYCLDEGAVAVANPLTNKTALHMACENGYTDVVVALLNRLPALLMIDDSPGETSLHIAARTGHTDIACNLLKVAEQTEVLKSIYGQPREEEASMGYLYDGSNNRHVMNEALPEIEVDVMARSANENRTALHDAAISGNTEVVQLLLDFLRAHSSSPRLIRSVGGRASLRQSPLPSSKAPPTMHETNLDDPRYSDSKATRCVPGVDMSTLKGRTAFHEASRHQHYDVMEVLLQAGADINAFMNMDLDPTVNTDLTALVQACLMDQPETVRFLLRHGAKDSRLKALSRSLKAKLYTVAGILLCYNNQVREVAADVARALALSVEGSKTFFQVMWNSKSLKEMCKEWLETVVCELPSYQDRSCAIAQIDLSTNQITDLPIELFRLPYLTTLDISRNQITALPHDEGKSNGGWACSRLSLLEAGKNQLTYFPPCLFQLKELKEVNACSNKITTVPASVWLAPKLCKLYLSGNMIEIFPASSQMASESSDEPVWNVSDSPSRLSSFSPTNFSGSAVSDSGYKSDAHNLSQQGDSVTMEFSGSPQSSRMERRPSLFPYALSNLHTVEHREQHTIQTQAVISRRLESFHDANMEVEELEELEDIQLGEGDGEAFTLEVLDLSGNQLTEVPANLSCLTPKLTKLNLARNRIKVLGRINDFPQDLEFLDVSRNALHCSLAPASSILDQRLHQPCARLQLSSPSHGGGASVGGDPSLGGTPTTSSFVSKLCSHRTHKNLRKLSTLKMNHNYLIDMQLFRSVNKIAKPDFSASMEEPTSVQRSNTMGVAVEKAVATPPMQHLSKSININFISRAAVLTKKTAHEVASPPQPLTPATPSSSGGGSKEEQTPASVAATSPALVISPLYPVLATLELSHNQLRSVPFNVHRISSLSSLLLSHNKDIDTLPLELSNLEHLWNLEYEGCALTNPPVEDLDKFRLASDKLMYMRSLLHE